MAQQPGRVIIVGAGPAGMALGYLLARRGIGVTVLEAHQDFARAFRGEGLQQSGIDVFRQMGLGERFDRLPHTELRTVEMYFAGRLCARVAAASLGRDGVRVVSQPAMLQMLAEEAAKYPSFRLELGVSMRDFLRENDRIVGIRATVAGDKPCEYRADLVIGADGRHAATRKQSGFPEISTPQNYDILWVRVPYPDAYPNRMTAQIEMAPQRMALVFPTGSGELQVGFVIAKGGFAELRSRGAEVWTEELIAHLPAYLATHLRKHREVLAKAVLLNVVCGRLTQWSTPGLLLIGDAAHPMSPVGGQGINIALRDALVTANHLCPVLLAGAEPSAVDAAAQRIQDERLPEIVAVQKMQAEHGRMVEGSSLWRTRLASRLLPLLLRTGLFQWLRRKENHQMSHGVVPVRLVA